MANKDNHRYEVRLHKRDNTEEFVYSDNDCDKVVGHALDCRKFNPEGNLLVYDLVNETVVDCI